MDLRGPPYAGEAVHREYGEVRSMAGPAFVLVLVLVMVWVQVFALIWGRKEPPLVASVVRDQRTQRLEPDIVAGREADEAR